MTPAEQSVAVCIERLRVVRGGKEVVRGVDLALRRGKVTGLLGPSGCGKSTLMRAIVGVQRGVSGRVTVLGLPAGSAALRGRVGYMTQAPSVYPDLSVRQNLEFFGRIVGAAPGAVDRIVEAVALQPYADRVASSLSSGQFARVSLGVALLHGREVLILDEPTVGLDPVLRRDLWALFHSLAADGAALLVSSHVMDEAVRCDELALMREGVLLAHEPPASLLQRTGATDIEDAFLRLARPGTEAAA